MKSQINFRKQNQYKNIEIARVKPNKSPERGNGNIEKVNSNTPQRNAKIKQSALMTIESSVDEFRKLKNAVLIDAARRASQMTRPRHLSSQSNY